MHANMLSSCRSHHSIQLGYQHLNTVRALVGNQLSYEIAGLPIEYIKAPIITTHPHSALSTILKMV